MFFFETCSRLLAGIHPLANALNKAVDSQNIPFFDAARGAGYDVRQEDLPNMFLTKTSYSSFVELHIEQGPILEDEGCALDKFAYT